LLDDGQLELFPTQQNQELGIKIGSIKGPNVLVGEDAALFQ
jgi:hypothetical protein